MHKCERLDMRGVVARTNKWAVHEWMTDPESRRWGCQALNFFWIKPVRLYIWCATDVVLHLFRVLTTQIYQFNIFFIMNTYRTSPNIHRKENLCILEGVPWYPRLDGWPATIHKHIRMNPRAWSNLPRGHIGSNQTRTDRLPREMGFWRN